ncbi:hypothetical protein BC936DRAFT_141483 [Jimgerdemannia flammicorona]|uniref:Uncharacterized protein n=1 Tax=Jimgerdemannia flammicorona TaxID=994334 RepID=A0A433A256_9FUNG|nr:hypothetical protein BC936DRAFT_141483 [Jimgerdemannia flammicorona]
MRATPSSLESLASHHSPTAQRNSSSSSLKVDNVSDSTITDDEDHGWEREMCEEQMKREIVSRLRVIRERARVERLRRGGNQGRFGDEDRRNEGESKDYTGQSDAAIRKSRIVPRLSSTSNNLSMLLTAARQLEATAPFRLDHTIHTTTAGTIGDLKQIMPSAMPSRKSAHSAWWAPNCEWSRRHPQWGGWKVSFMHRINDLHPFAVIRFTDPITPTQLRHRIPPSNVVTAFPPELPPLHPGPPGDSHPTPLPSLHSVVEYQRPTQLGHSDGGTRAYGANRSNGIRKLRDNSSVNDLVRHLQVVFNDFTIQATMLLCEDDGEWDYLLERAYCSFYRY